MYINTGEKSVQLTLDISAKYLGEILYSISHIFNFPVLVFEF